MDFGFVQCHCHTSSGSILSAGPCVGEASRSSLQRFLPPGSMSLSVANGRSKYSGVGPDHGSGYNTPFLLRETNRLHESAGPPVPMICLTGAASSDLNLRWEQVDLLFLSCRNGNRAQSVVQDSPGLVHPFDGSRCPCSFLTLPADCPASGRAMDCSSCFFSPGMLRD